MMQDLIKRYFWVVGVVTIIVCSVFAAKATGAILEAKFLGDPAKGPKIAPVIRNETPAKSQRTKDGTQLATRNIFCSTCTPAVPVAVTGDPSSIANTSLPIVLLATNIGSDDKHSYATIVNNDSQKQGLYMIGDVVPGASGKVTTIRYKYVDFENGGRIERVMLAGLAAPVATPVAVAEAPVASENKDDLESAVDAGIKKIDDTTFEIDKALIAKVTENPMAFMKGARVVPSIKNGKTEGVKLYAIRPNSPYAKLGLSNGDTLSSVNGFELTDINKGLEIYTKLREATSLELEIIRRGKPVTLKYTIK